MIIIMRFGENNVLGPKYINIYINFSGLCGGYIVNLKFFVYYSWKCKKYKSMTFTKIKFYIILISIFFPRMNKKILKRWPLGALLLFLYEVSIVVLIDFIAILLTPCIFLIQIVNTNNTNMYLINFHIKNIIKIHFS